MKLYILNWNHEIFLKSEFIENREEMFHLYYMHSDIELHWSATRIQKFYSMLHENICKLRILIALEVKNNLFNSFYLANVSIDCV